MLDKFVFPGECPKTQRRQCAVIGSSVCGGLPGHRGQRNTHEHYVTETLRMNTENGATETWGESYRAYSTPPRQTLGTWCMVAYGRNLSAEETKPEGSQVQDQPEKVSKTLPTKSGLPGTSLRPGKQGLWSSAGW